MNARRWMPMIVVLLANSVLAETELDALLGDYAAQSQESLDARRGEKLWRRQFPDGSGTQTRSCSSCHGDDLSLPGRHRKTRKVIAAMAPSVNPQRLQSARKIRKWLRRNCKWTLGRECSAREKGDLLLFLRQQ